MPGQKCVCVCVGGGGGGGSEEGECMHEWDVGIVQSKLTNTAKKNIVIALICNISNKQKYISLYKFPPPPPPF